MNKEEFIIYVKELGINLNKEKMDKLENYYELLVKWNEKFNLTRIIDEKDVLLKHFYDSLCLIKAIDLNKYNSLVDIGTGAGFPGLVISIFFDNLQVTLVESSTKKCTFLEAVRQNLNLNNVIIKNERAEIFSKNNIEKYDLATCRAVSHLSTISEIAIPMLKINGYFLPLKADISIELKESKDKLKNLNASLEKTLQYNLPIENSFRTIPIIKKITKTNEKYPRDYNKIIKDLKK